MNETSTPKLIARIEIIQIGDHYEVTGFTEQPGIIRRAEFTDKQFTLAGAYRAAESNIKTALHATTRSAKG